MIDHVVYGVAALEAGVEELAGLLGVRPGAGGRHVGRGTHNALLGLGGSSYLEVIAIDPSQPAPQGPVAFDLDRVRLPRLVAWATRTEDIDRLVASVRGRGYEPGEVQAMSRRRPDGFLLEWRLSRRDTHPNRPVVPFIIDWGGAPHPSESAPAGLRLVELRATHPDPAAVGAELAALEARIAVDEGPEPGLTAVLDSPRGRVVLR